MVAGLRYRILTLKEHVLTGNGCFAGGLQLVIPAGGKYPLHASTIWMESWAFDLQSPPTDCLVESRMASGGIERFLHAGYVGFH